MDKSIITGFIVRKPKDVNQSYSVDDVAWSDDSDLQDEYRMIAASKYGWMQDCAQFTDSNGLVPNISVKLLKELPRHFRCDDICVLGIGYSNQTYNALKKAIGEVNYLIEASCFIGEDLLNSGWTLLGFDIADRELYSALVNFPNEDYLALVSEYINDFGLIDDEQEAFHLIERYVELQSHHTPMFPTMVYRQPS